MRSHVKCSSSCFKQVSRHLWKLNFIWTHCYLSSFLPSVFLLIIFFNEGIKKMKGISEILNLVLRLSQWAVSFTLGKQLILLRAGGKEVCGESIISICLSVTLSRFPPFQFVEGLCPLSVVWSCVSHRERGKRGRVRDERKERQKEAGRSLWYSLPRRSLV